jgi:hypothetical protein
MSYASTEFSTAQSLLVKMDTISMIWMTGKHLVKTKHQAISLSRLLTGLYKEIEAFDEDTTVPQAFAERRDLDDFVNRLQPFLS